MAKKLSRGQPTYDYKLISHAGETMYSFLKPVRATQGSKDRRVGLVRISPRILHLGPGLSPIGIGSWVPLWTQNTKSHGTLMQRYESSKF